MTPKKPLVIDGGVRWAPVDEAFYDFPAARTEDRRAMCRTCGRPSHTVDGRSVHSWRQAAPIQPRPAVLEVLAGIFTMLVVLAGFYFAALLAWSWGFPRV